MAGDAPAELYAPAFDFGTDPVPLIELADWFNGLAFKNIDFSTDGLPVVKIAEIKNGISDSTKRTQADYDPRFRLADGDLLFCWSGQPETSIGTFIWSQGDAWLNQHIFRVVAKEGVDPDFLHFLMLYLQPNFQAIAANKQTTGLGHVTKRDLGDMLVQLPDITEQIRIVEVLQPIQQRIVLGSTMATTLEEAARALFRSWFVDFAPVHAKAEGDFFDLPADLADLFADKFDGAGLPEGWSEATLERIADVNPESWRASNRPDQVKYVDLSNTKFGTIEATTNYKWNDAPSRARRIARAGDTIVGTVRPGNGSYAYIGLNGLTVSTGFAVLRPKKSISKELLYIAVTMPENIDRLANLAAGHGGAYPAVNPCVVISTSFPEVPDALVKAFSDSFAASWVKIEQMKAESANLAELRDTLLPKLISGELRISEAASAVAAA